MPSAKHVSARPATPSHDPIFRPDPHEAAFKVARRAAADSEVVKLTAGALELADGGVIAGLEATEDALRKAYAANGIGTRRTHALENVDFELSLRSESGYLFGLAISMTLGRGGVR